MSSASTTDETERARRSAASHFRFGLRMHTSGRLEAAAGSYRLAVRYAADYVEAWENLANVLWGLNLFEEASEAYRRVVDLKPGDPAGYSGLGATLQAYGRTEEASEAYRTVIALQPDDEAGYAGLGATLQASGRAEEAMPYLHRALEIKPDSVVAYAGLAAAHGRLGHTEEAMDACRKALEIDPNDPETNIVLGCHRLQQGDYTEGWRLYEWRIKTRGFRGPVVTQPAWDGSPLDGKTLLVYTEQGLGDAIQFVRFLPLLKGRGAGRVVLACFEYHFQYMSKLLADCDGVDEIVTINARNRIVPYAAHDLQTGLLSLPFLMGTTLETIPARVPYLSVDELLVERWRNLVGDDPAFKVGLRWAGARGHTLDKRRSCKLSDFAPLAEVPGVRFYSLQVDEGSEQAANPPAGMHLVDLTTELSDLSDTAALMTCLDLVISVDTSVTHLAGALGRPVWTLLDHIGEWRWLMDREDSPWYPTMRLFRQRRLGDWNEVFDRVTEALRQASTPT